MKKIEVVNMKTHRDDPAVIYVGRRMGPTLPGSPLGNPFKLADARHATEATRTEVLRKYSQWLTLEMGTPDSLARAEIERLTKLAQTQDIKLACWCAPLSCHAEIIKAEIERRLVSE